MEAKVGSGVIVMPRAQFAVELEVQAGDQSETGPALFKSRRIAGGTAFSLVTEEGLTYRWSVQDKDVFRG